jgi:hypothetical protein
MSKRVEIPIGFDYVRFIRHGKGSLLGVSPPPDKPFITQGNLAAMNYQQHYR